MQKHYLADIIEPVAEAQGFAVVRILTIGETNPVLQIMIEHKNYEQDVTVDDCALVSRAISAVLDEKDPMQGRYTLEVSSPGLDRPLTTPDHFRRYKGALIKLETAEPIEKRKRFKGTIDAVSADDVITLMVDETTYNIAFDNIVKAKIVLTDELVDAYLKSHPSVQA